MALGTYAALDEEGKVFDIVQFDVLEGGSGPYPDATYIRVGEPTPTPVPEIGQTWDGDTNTFI